MTTRPVRGRRTRVLVRGRPHRRNAIGSLMAGLVVVAFYAAVAWFTSGPRAVFGFPYSGNSFFSTFMTFVVALFVVALILGTPAIVREWRGPVRLSVTGRGLGWPRGESGPSGQVGIPWSEIVEIGLREPAAGGYLPGAETTAVLDLLAVAYADAPSVAHGHRAQMWWRHRVPEPFDHPPVIPPADGPHRHLVPPWPDALVVTVALRAGNLDQRRLVGRALTEIDGLAREAAEHDRERVAAALVEVRDRVDRWQRSWSAAARPCTHHLVVDRSTVDIDGLARAAARAGTRVVHRGPLGPGDLDTPHLLARVAADTAARRALRSPAPVPLGRRMRIAAVTEDVALLLHDPRSGTPVSDSDALPRVLAGALLLDLVACGRITRRRGRVVVVDRGSADDALVGRAVERLGGGGSARRSVERLRVGLPAMVMARLAGAGLVCPAPGGRWPAVDPADREALRVRLGMVLARDAPPSEHEIAVITMIGAVRDLRTFADVPRRALKARVARLPHDPWLATAVRKAVKAQQSD